MTIYVVKKNKNKDEKPYIVALKKGFAEEGEKFDSSQVLCGDEQLNNILAENPCRIKKVEPPKTKNKSKDKDKTK